MKASISRRKTPFVTPWSYDRTKNVNSVTGGKSITLPNQSLSVREIMIRFTRGVGTPGREPSYNEEYIPDVDAMDLAEREEFMVENLNRIKAIQAEREARAKAKHQPEPAPAASGKKVGEKHVTSGNVKDGADDGANSSEA